MDAFTLAIEPDEALGLRALAAAAAAGSKDATPAELGDLARELLRTGLDARLEALGLPWAPGPEQLRAATVPSPATGPRLIGAARTSTRLRIGSSVALASVVLVLLAGGYLDGWRWTGFRDNEQLWDWLQLLLLPVVLATVPLWLRHGDRIGRGRQIGYCTVVAAFAGFTVVGYLAPLAWTGFVGNTLWDWFSLLLLPLTLVLVQTWSKSGRRVRPRHLAAAVVLAAGWLLTIIGGYVWGWTWTGYQGNTLWDWLQLALVPVLVPTIVVPALARLATGDVAHRISEERQRAYRRGMSGAADQARSPAAAATDAGPIGTLSQ